MKAVIILARKGGLRPTLILSSPYVRALETAKLAADELDYEKQRIQTSESLVPHSTPERVWAELASYSGEDAILLTGHEPLLGHCVPFFLNSPNLRVEFKKAAIVRLDVPGVRGGPAGVLEWMITPKLAG